MRRLILTVMLVLVLAAVAMATNVQDNYYYVHSIIDNSGDHVSGETVALKIKRVSDGYWLDFDDDTFKASGWVSATVNLSEDTTNEYYYYTFNPPASETAAGQYLFVIDNASATYGDHQSYIVSYTNVEGIVFDGLVADHQIAGSLSKKIDDIPTSETGDFTIDQRSDILESLSVDDGVVGTHLEALKTQIKIHR